MAKSVNKVILLGNVGKDPEIKVLPSGQPVANFSIATGERFKDQQGNFQERTEWHNLTAYGKLAEIVRDYVKKGNKLYVEGRLTTRSWDDKETNKKVYRTEIVIGDLSLLSGRGEDGGGQSAGGLLPAQLEYRQLRPATLRRRRLRSIRRNHRRRYSVLGFTYSSCANRFTRIAAAVAVGKCEVLFEQLRMQSPAAIWVLASDISRL